MPCSPLKGQCFWLNSQWAIFIAVREVHPTHELSSMPWN
jgi:hypothetical protein